jgi:hypothetical protein
MNRRVERTIRVIDDHKATPSQVAYWRTRSPMERLEEMLRLHREGNDLFRGGNPDFVYIIRTRDVGDS